MKKYYFTLFLILFTSMWYHVDGKTVRTDSCGIDTTYLPFVIDDVSWIIGIFDKSKLTVYRINADTIVNNIKYKNIFKYELEPKNIIIPPYKIRSQTHFGFVREDNKRVYLLPNQEISFACSADHEFLLYDFNKIEGDTIYSECIDTVPSDIGILESVYCTELFGYFVKKYDSRSDYIEAVGRSDDPFLPLPYKQTTENVFSVAKYCRGDFSDCGFNFLDVVDDTMIDVEIFPNPTIDEVNIKLNIPFDVVVYDILGHQIYESKCHDTQERILLSDWPKGIYIYKIVSKDDRGKSKLGRFVKS